MAPHSSQSGAAVVSPKPVSTDHLAPRPSIAPAGPKRSLTRAPVPEGLNGNAGLLTIVTWEQPERHDDDISCSADRA